MKRRGLPLAAALKLCAVRLGGAAVQYSPALARRLAGPAGSIAAVLNAPALRQVRGNLRALLPDATDDALRNACRGVFRSVALYYVDLLALPATSAETLGRRTEVEGYSWIPRLLAEGRGCILTGIHCGPSELVLQAFAARGVHYTAIVERVEPPRVNDYILRARRSLGNRYVHPDRDGLRVAIRVLRAGGLVALLVDRDVLGTGIAARFCDREIDAPPGAVELAALTGAPLLPATVFWTRDGRYRATIQPPIYVDRRARKGPALRQAVERLLACFAPHLRAHPDQWFVLGRYWRG